MKKLTAPYLMIGSSQTCPNIRYLTRFNVTDNVVVMYTGKETFLIVSDLEYGRAVKEAKDCVVESPDTLKLTGTNRYNLAEWALSILQKHNYKSVDVNGDFPLRPTRSLEKSGITINIPDVNAISELRAIKSEYEIECITHVQNAARNAMRAVGLAIKNSTVNARGELVWQDKILTSERAKEIVRNEVLKSGCVDKDTIIAGGNQAVNPHETGSGPLKTREWIVCDIFPYSLGTGYWGDMTRTFMNGTPSKEQRHIYNTVAKAQKLALAKIKAGVNGATVHKLVKKVFTDEGFDTFVKSDGIPQGFFHGTGHGVGLEIHENPRIANSEQKLKAGMVVTVEPGLYYTDIGGVRIEDTVVVQKDGVKIL